MHRHLGWALASFIAVGTAGQAVAADMAVKAPPMVPPAVYNWTGLYAGVNGGWAFDGNTTGTYVTNDPIANVAIAGGDLPRNNLVKHEGGFGGAQVGYNWQKGMWVYGVEGDIQGADIGKTSTIFFPGSPAGGGLPALTPSTTTSRDHIDWFGTVRGRVGVASNTVLFYATGGFAFGGVQTSYLNAVAAPGLGAANFSNSDTRFGWAAGVGVEWAFAPKWSVRAEYLHVDLGSNDFVARVPRTSRPRPTSSPITTIISSMPSAPP